MSFVHLGGESSAKPTFFEVLAADQLVPGLRAAVVYVVSALSQHHSWLHRLLHYEDELLALVMLLVDWHSLSTADATFAESLYGMQRRPLAPAPGPAGASAPGGGDQPSSSSSSSSSSIGSGPNPLRRISQRQRLLGLLLQVSIPFLESKLERLYKLHVNQGPLGLALRGASSRGRGSSGAGQEHGGSSLRTSLLRLFLSSYPWLHAGAQSLQFAYHAAYLLSSFPVHRPGLHVLGMHLTRVSAQDMELMAKDKAEARRAQLAPWSGPPRSPGSQLLGAAMRGGLRLSHLLADHHRSALILAVFGYKALEWWYTSAEDRLTVNKVLPPPPPPPPPVPSPQGVGLPSDPSLCPLCRHPCTNPAQLTCSGFVFCYPCLFGFVMDRGQCPVTCAPASLDHIRKLYEGQ